MVNTMPTLDILIAAYPGNFGDIQHNLPRIIDACEEKLTQVRWRVTIAYNGNDASLNEAVKLAQSLPHVRVTYVKNPGKGNAVLNNIRTNTGDFVSYMDADVATDLKDFSALIAAVLNSDLASGSRYHPQSTIQRDWLRFAVSSVYTMIILRLILGAQFTDPQCGFKALNRKRMLPIIEQVHDAWFFFETEFTYLAQKNGMKIVEIPISWIERPNSSVKLIPTIINFLHNLFRLRFGKKTQTIPPWVEDVKVIHDSDFKKSEKNSRTRSRPKIFSAKSVAGKK